jgi:hypothetical protein
VALPAAAASVITTRCAAHPVVALLGGRAIAFGSDGTTADLLQQAGAPSAIVSNAGMIGVATATAVSVWDECGDHPLVPLAAAGAVSLAIDRQGATLAIAVLDGRSVSVSRFSWP